MVLLSMLRFIYFEIPISNFFLRTGHKNDDLEHDCSLNKVSCTKVESNKSHKNIHSPKNLRASPPSLFLHPPLCTLTTHYHSHKKVPPAIARTWPKQHTLIAHKHPQSPHVQPPPPSHFFTNRQRPRRARVHRYSAVKKKRSVKIYVPHRVAC